jgi:hypothetical protein
MGLSDGVQKRIAMSATVLPFQKPHPQKRKIRAPSAPELVRKVRRMQKFGRMLMRHPQIKQWLLQKSVTSMQMLSTIKLGQPTGEPVLDENGDCRITLKRVAAGRKTQITLAVKADHFVIVNVN